MSNLVAFTGGGWNAMAGHSGWIGAALQASKQLQLDPMTLDQLFAETNKVAGNSGGSWFLSMLAYSEEFANKLLSQPKDWFGDGYMGEQKKIFDDAPNQTSPSDLFQIFYDQSMAVVKESLDQYVSNFLSGYSSLDPFSGLNGFISEIRRIDFFGASALVDSITQELDRLFTQLTLETIESLGLTNKIDDSIRDALGLILGDSLLKAVSALVFNPLSEDHKLLDWYESVKETAFKPYNLGSLLSRDPRSLERLSWAEDRDLLFPLSVSGQPTVIESISTNKYLLSALNPTSGSALPTDAGYLIPITAKSGSKSRLDLSYENTIIFPEHALAYSGYLSTGSSKDLELIKEVDVQFPHRSDLTILETVVASGSFAGELALPSAIEAIVASEIDGIVTALNGLKYQINDIVHKYPSQILDSIRAAIHNFFDSLRKPTDTGHLLTDEANHLFNLALDIPEKAAIGALDLVPVRVFEQASSLIVDGLYDGLLALFNSSKKITEPLFLSIASIVSDLAVPAFIQPDSISMLQQENQVLVDSATPLISIFDGGLTDNTGVLASIQEWQSEYGDEHFVINAFINGTNTVELGLQSDGANPAIVPVDFARLFGLDGTVKDDSLVQAFPLSLDDPGKAAEIPTIPAAYPFAFDNKFWFDSANNRPLWEFKTSDDFGIAYYQINVTTVANPAWGIKEGSHGVLNAFTSYNKNSSAGPIDVNGLNIWQQYEKLYNSIFEGIVESKGYQYLLSSFDLINYSINANTITFDGSADFSQNLTIRLESVSDDYSRKLYSADFFIVDVQTEERKFLGSVASCRPELSLDFTSVSNSTLLKQNNILEILLSSEGSEVPIPADIKIESGKNLGDFLISIKDIGSDNELLRLSADLSIPKPGSIQSAVPTPRFDQSDTYISLKSGEIVVADFYSGGSYINQVSIVKVDVDVLTGQISLNGFKEDSEGFDHALRQAFDENSVIDAITLQPFSQKVVSFTPKESGLYAPVVHSQEGYLFLGEHNLDSRSTQSRMLGANTFGFEDIHATRTPDYDFNDVIVTFAIDTGL